jgi:hypothetical protein
LNADFFKDMREAGNFDLDPASPSGNKVLSSKAYARYECTGTGETTGTLCLKVVLEPGFSLVPGNSWFKIYDLRGSGVPPSYPTGSSIVEDSSGLTGWEGCFVVEPGCYQSVEIHANFGETGSGQSRTSSTGKVGFDTALDLQCDTAPAAAPTPAPVIGSPTPPTPPTPPNPSATPTGDDVTPPATEAPSSSPTFVNECDVDGDCLVPAPFHQTCVLPTCETNDYGKKVCAYPVTNVGVSCDPSSSQHECDLGLVCDATGGCTDNKFKDANAPCYEALVDPGFFSTCAKYTCQADASADPSSGATICTVGQRGGFALSFFSFSSGL